MKSPDFKDDSVFDPENSANTEQINEEPSGLEAAADAEVKAEENKGVDFAAELFDWAEALITALLFITILFSFFVRTIGVSGSSMEKTLHDGNYLIVSNLFYEPKAGDIVIITKKSFSEDSIVKRIIATEGQKVDIDFISGTVYIDDVAQNESYVNTKTNAYEGMNFPQVVPENCVFVLGDNRNRSEDSRDPALGMVDKSLIVGHVLFRIWPINSIGTVK